MAKKRDTQTTQTYDLKQSNKVVYRGTTNDPERREQEHRDEGKRFDTLQTTSRKLTPASAKQREADQLETYRRGHKGKNPVYNEDNDG